MFVPHGTFIFDSYYFDKNERNISLNYQLRQRETTYSFSEKLFFPHNIDIDEDTVSDIAFHLHLACGVSYWKLSCAPEIVVNSGVLNRDMARFWQQIYTRGMGEFLYRNKIKIDRHDLFPSVTVHLPRQIPFVPGPKPLVAFGGGKDSLVTVELLKKNGISPTLYTLFSEYEHRGVLKVAEKTGYSLLSVRRVIDPQLFLISQRQEVPHGHIPISIIYMMTGVALAAMTGHSGVVMSNERSANEGNIYHEGHEVNHQWSKSIEAEKLLNEYIIGFINPGLSCFSLLRPYSELAITRAFSGMSRYHQFFSSCNRNFVHDAHKDFFWCGACAKCAFVFVMLAAFLPLTQLIDIFGSNLFEKTDLIPLFHALLGEGMKPFDCVGTPEEVQAAFILIDRSHKYDNSLMMREFKTHFYDNITNHDGLIQKAFSPQHLETIPPAYQHISLDQLVQSTRL